MHIVTSLSNEKKQIKTLFVSSTFTEAETFIQNLKSIKVNNENINITAVRKYPPSETDHDGYYLVHNDFCSDQFDLFSKKTIISRGYIYNGVELEIKQVLTIYITYYNSREHQSSVSSLTTSNSVSTPQKSSMTQSGDLIDRGVYNTLLGQLLEKAQEKEKNKETLEITEQSGQKKKVQFDYKTKSKNIDNLMGSRYNKLGDPQHNYILDRDTKKSEQYQEFAKAFAKKMKDNPHQCYPCEN